MFGFYRWEPPVVQPTHSNVNLEIRVMGHLWLSEATGCSSLTNIASQRHRTRTMWQDSGLTPLMVIWLGPTEGGAIILSSAHNICTQTSTFSTISRCVAQIFKSHCVSQVTCAVDADCCCVYACSSMRVECLRDPSS